MLKKNKAALAAAVACCALLVGVSDSRAAARNWDGGGADNNFNTATNWANDTLPTWTGQTDDLYFGGDVQLTPNNNITNADVNGLYFDAGAGAFVITGNEISVGSAGSNTTDRIVNNSSVTQTISTAVKTRYITIDAAAGDIVFNGSNLNIGNSPNTSGRQLTITGAFDTHFDIQGNIVGGGITSGTTYSHNIIKNGSGTLFINQTGNNTWYGQMTINTGAVRILNNTALGQATSAYNTIIKGNTGGSGRLELANNISVAEFITLEARQGATIELPHIVNISGNNTLTGPVTLTTGGSDYNLQSNAGKLTITSNLNTPNSGDRKLKLMGDGDGELTGVLNTTGGVNTLNITKRGAGTWTLSGNNTMGTSNSRAVLSVEGGRLIFSGNSATKLNTNIAGGMLVVSGSMSDAGAVTINSGGLEVSGSIGVAEHLTINGGTATIKSTGSIGTNLYRVMGDGTFDVTDFAGGYALNAGQTLAGTGTVLGTINAGGGASIIAGDGGAGLLTLGGLNLSGGGAMEFNLGYNHAWVNVADANALVANGTTMVNVLGAGLTVGQHTLIDYAGALGGGGLGGFTLGVRPNRVTATLVNNAANSSIDLNVTAVDSIKWTGTAGDAWDINGTVNWREINSGNATTYLETAGQPGDEVLFDNTAVSTLVNLTTNVNPARITVNSAGVDYTFAGPGKIGGVGGLIKRGDGKLTIANQNANDYSAPTVIEAGIVQIGDLAINGGIGGSFGSGVITNDGTIIFARTDDHTVANKIDGTGAIEKLGAGVMTLSGASTYDGAVTISEGTLRLGNGAALGSTAGGTTVVSGATLDVNGQNIGAEPVSVIGDGVNGEGAMVNRGAGQNNALLHVTLAGNTTVGGTGRFDVRGEGATFTGNGHKLTKVGTNQISIIGTGQTNIGDIVINQGTLSFESGAQLGEQGTLTINREGSLQLFDTVGYTVPGKPTTSNGGRIVNWQGSNVYEAPLKLEIDYSVYDADTEINVNSGTLTMPGLISGEGDLRKTGGGVFVPGGANTYAGTTRVAGGVLSASVLVNGGLPSSIGQSGRSASYLVLEGGTLRYTGEAATTDRAFTLSQAGGTLNASGAGPIQFTSPEWIGLAGIGARTLTLNGTNTGENLLAATIADDGVNATSIAKREIGAWALGGNNTYVGITTVHGGTLKIISDNALGGTAGITRILDNTANPAPASLHLDSATGITVPESFETTGGGGGGFNANGPGVIRSVRGNNTITGNIKLISGGGDSTFTVDAGSTLTLAGTMTNDTAYFRTAYLGGAGEGVISGAIVDTSPRTMSINKVGAGRWTLSGANTYLGNTTITAGTLKVASTGSILSPNIILAASGEGTFDVQDFGAAGFSLGSGQTLSGIGSILGTLNAEAGSSVTLATAGTIGVMSFQNGGLSLRGGTLNYDLAAIAASDMIQLGSGLLATNGQTMTINVTDQSLEVGTYKLIDYGSFTGSLGDLNLVPSVLGGFALSLLDSGTSIDLVVSAGADLNQWITALGGNYGDAANWKTGAVPNGINENARFWSQGSGAVTVDLPVTVGTISIDNTVAYSIDGPAAITLDAGGLTPSIKAVSGSHTISAPLVLNATSTVNVQAAGSTLTVSGVVSGSGKGIIKMGAGTLVLAGDNTYTGPTRLDMGVLAVGSLKDGGVAGTLGTSSSTAGNLVFSGGTLRYTGAGDSTNRLFTLGAGALAGTIQASGTGPVNFTATSAIAFMGDGERTLTLGGTNTGANTLSAAINDSATGATAVAKSDAGAWVLAGNSSYTGMTTVNGGLLIAGTPAALGGALGGTIVRADTGGTLGVQGNITVAEPVEILGSASGVGLRNVFDVNTWSGEIAMAGGNGDNYRIQSDAGKLTVSGGIVNNVPATITTARVLHLQGDGDGEVSGVIGGGTGMQPVALTKSGAGTWTLSNANNFTGNVNISAGALRITSPNALGDTVGGTLLAGELTTGQLHLDGGIYVSEERLTLSARQPANPVPHVVNVGGDNTWAGPISFNTGGLNYMIQSEAGKLTLAGNITNDTGTTNTGNRDLYLGGASDGEVTGSIGGGNAPGPINVIKDGAGTWTISNYNSYTGTTRVKAGTLKLGASAGLTTSGIHVDAGAVFDVSDLQTYYMQSPTSLSGSGVVSGGISATYGNDIRPGVAGVAGTLTIDGSFSSTLAALHYDLAPANTVGDGVNDLLVVTGDLVSYSSTPTQIYVNPTGGTLAGTYRLINYGGSFADQSPDAFTVSGAADIRQTFTIDTSTANQVNLIVNGSAGNLIWSGDGFANAWDLGTFNWKHPVNPDRFYTLDHVTFDDTGSTTPNVNLTTTLLPGAVTVNSSNDYTFAGAGKLSGATGITKQGTGTLTLSTANDFTGTVTISGGILKVANAAALGSMVGATVINGAGTLDVNGTNLGFEPIRVEGAGVNGAGAIISTGAEQQQALRDVTLTGDATFGGSGRWDIRKPSGSTASLAGNGHTLTKIGPNFIGFIDLGETGLGDININEGTLSFEYTSTLGDPAKTATIRTGGTLMFWNNPNLNDKVLVLDGGSIFANAPAATPPVTVQTFVGPITLASESTVQASANQTLLLSGDITGPGRLTKINTGIVSLTGTNDYVGGTTISAGTLRVTTSSLPGDVINDAALIFNQGFEGEFAGSITGVGTVTKQNTGTVTLSGDSGYSGITGVTGGVLRITSETALGAASGITRVVDGTANPAPASLQLDSETGLTLAESFETSGGGSGGFNANGPGVIRSVRGDNIINGSIRLISGGGDSTFTVDAGSTLTLAGAMTNDTGFFRTAYLGGAGEGVISGSISDTSPRTMSVNKVGAGTWTLSGANTYTGTTTVTEGKLVFGSPQKLTALNIAAGAVAQVAAGGEKVLAVNVLNLSGSQGAWTSLLDLEDNHLAVLAAAGEGQAQTQRITDMVKSGMAGIAGITSMPASPYQSLAVVLNDLGDGTPLMTDFGGIPVDADSVLTRTTWFGDSDVNGTLDGDDYYRLDRGYLAQPVSPLYGDGDINYDGVVDGRDYHMIDLAFLNQTAAPVALQGSSAVPEPGTLGLLALAAGMACLRRRRGRQEA